MKDLKMLRTKALLITFFAAIAVGGCGKSDELEKKSPQTTEVKSSIEGKFAYTKKIENYELGGEIEIAPLPKPNANSKYKAHFNGYYLRGDTPNVCDFEENLIQVTTNVYSMKSGKDSDAKFNLILVFEGGELTIYSTDEIEGCGAGAESSVAGKYKLSK